jgi:hypothetical protein
MKRPLPFHSNAVWPPPLLTGLLIFSYGLFAGAFWLISLSVPSSGRTSFRESANNAGVFMVIIGLFAGLYAAFRLFRFHPACNRAYASWLKLTPWTAAKPLPLGPIHPVWQDAAVIGALSALAHWHTHGDSLTSLVAFASVYLIGMTILLGLTRRWWNFLALGFLWPALMLPSVAGTPGIIIIVAIIVVIWHGHIQSLKAFPWVFLKAKSPDSAAPPVLQTDIRIDLDFGQTSGAASNLGWPYSILSPKLQTVSVSNRTNLAQSLLLGWWSYCIIVATQMEPEPEVILFGTVVAAIFRLAIYGGKAAAPFNLWGRITSGRLIIPGYDRVFLTPLATVLAAAIGAIIIKRAGPWFPVAEACTIAAAWYVLFGGGPSLRNWILTGQLRLRPPGRGNSNKQTLKPI